MRNHTAEAVKILVLCVLFALRLHRYIRGK